MKVKKPEDADSRTADRIRAEAEGYLTAGSDAAERETGKRDLVEKYRRELERLGDGRNPQAEQGGESQARTRRKQRTRHGRKQGTVPSPQPTAGREE